MAKITDLMTDLKKERDGIWVTHPPSGLKCLIARQGNTKVAEARNRIMRDPNWRKTKSGQARDQEIISTLADIVAEFVLLDWEDLGDENNEPTPYSREKATKLLANPACHDFLKWVLDISDNEDYYRLEIEEEDKGNSSATSSGD